MTRIYAPDSLAIEYLEKGDWGGVPGRGCPEINAQIQALVVHHSGVDNRPRNRGEAHAAGRSIQNFHMNTREWLDIAYNKWIAYDQLADGRGRHCRNGANRGTSTLGNFNTLSIMLVGNFDLYPPTDIEKNLILDFADYLNLPIQACPGECLIIGHKDVSPTGCPGRHVIEWLEDGAPRPGTFSDAVTPTNADLVDCRRKLDEIASIAQS